MPYCMYVPREMLSSSTPHGCLGTSSSRWTGSLVVVSLPNTFVEIVSQINPQVHPIRCRQFGNGRLLATHLSSYGPTWEPSLPSFVSRLLHRSSGMDPGPAVGLPIIMDRPGKSLQFLGHKSSCNSAGPATASRLGNGSNRSRLCCHLQTIVLRPPLMSKMAKCVEQIVLLICAMAPSRGSTAAILLRGTEYSPPLTPLRHVQLGSCLAIVLIVVLVLVVVATILLSQYLVLCFRSLRRGHRRGQMTR